MLILIIIHSKKSGFLLAENAVTQFENMQIARLPSFQVKFQKQAVWVTLTNKKPCQNRGRRGTFLPVYLSYQTCRYKLLNVKNRKKKT